MPSTTFTVRIDSAVKKRLERLARSTGRSRSFSPQRRSVNTSMSTSGKLLESNARSLLLIVARACQTQLSKIGSPGAARRLLEPVTMVATPPRQVRQTLQSPDCGRSSHKTSRAGDCHGRTKSTRPAATPRILCRTCYLRERRPCSWGIPCPHF
jgi:hypothetical protein